MELFILAWLWLDDVWSWQLGVPHECKDIGCVQQEKNCLTALMMKELRGPFPKKVLRGCLVVSLAVAVYSSAI